LGDLAPIYLAILRNTDPAPVKTIDKIKKKMKRKFKIIEKLEEEMHNIAQL
jgi:hypothetical protein